MNYVECPGCLTDLRILPMNELAQLGTRPAGSTLR